MQQDFYPWPHKNLLDVTQLSGRDVFRLLDTARAFHEVARRPVKKVPTLKGRTVVLFFSEPSTRTRVSFDTAAKRLSADTFTLGPSGSSLQKGETLKDTALTLQAMSPDALVLRDASSGSAQFLAERLSCAVINAGDGWHAHPSQALLDLYALREAWHGEFAGKTLLLLGDAGHSRVARSNLHLLTRLGVRVRLCAPRTLLPAGADAWPAEVYGRLEDAVRGVDAVMCLRLQLERQQAGLLPDLRDYSSRYCLTPSRLALANPGARVLHPGPMNRGLEISSELADAPQSRILDQVEAGVAVRMAALLLLAGRPDASLNPQPEGADA
jgi:aspartate carbamoyltransferase catalytic subunit